VSTQTKRRCNGKTCITILSSYNSDTDGFCGACRLVEAAAAVIRFRGREAVPPATRAGSQMWRVLRSMPASTREIAAATGIDLDKVRVTARDACTDGRAERRRRTLEGSRPVSRGGSHEYVCLVDLPGPTGAAGGAKYTRESLIVALHDMRRFLGRAPIAEDCGTPWPSRTTFDRHFKSWNEALHAAEIRAKVAPRADLVRLLSEGPSTSTELAKRLGRSVNAVTSNLCQMYRDGVAEREWVPQGRRYVYRLVPSRPA